MEIKVGDIVYLNSNPEIKMTVNHVEAGKIQAVYFNSTNGKWEYTPILPIQTVSVSEK